MGIHDQFEKYQLYRRLLVAYACGLTWYATERSVAYAFASDLPGLEVAAVITAIQVPLAGIMAFVSKLYWSGRDAG